MKKLLFITTRLFWPTDSGRKVSLYHYCKGLHEVCGYDISLYSFLEPGQTEDLLQSKPDFIGDVTLASPAGKLTKLTNLATKSAFGRWPFQNSLYYSEKNVRRIRELCNGLQPDLVIVDMERLAPYYKAFKRLNAKKILDLDDLLSKRYERQYRSAASKSNILGVYAGAASGSEKKLLNNGKIKNFVLKSESKRVAKFEVKYGKLYDKVIFVSDKETEEFNKTVREKAVTVRLGVDYPYFADGAEVEKEPASLAFVGNMKVAANADSLDILVKCVLPKLHADCKLYVIGSVSDELKAQYATEKIVFCGRVEDLRPAVKKCGVFVAPIPYGSGVKTKILEAMAMGMPVVTNSVGAEGIDGVNGKHFIVEDDYDKMADAVNGLVGDGEKREALSANGQLLMQSLYDWQRIYSDMNQLFE